MPPTQLIVGLVVTVLGCGWMIVASNSYHHSAFSAPAARTCTRSVIAARFSPLISSTPSGTEKLVAPPAQRIAGLPFAVDHAAPSPQQLARD